MFRNTSRRDSLRCSFMLEWCCNIFAARKKLTIAPACVRFLNLLDANSHTWPFLSISGCDSVRARYFLSLNFSLFTNGTMISTSISHIYTRIDLHGFGFSVPLRTKLSFWALRLQCHPCKCLEGTMMSTHVILSSCRSKYKVNIRAEKKRREEEYGTLMLCDIYTCVCICRIFILPVCTTRKTFKLCIAHVWQYMCDVLRTHLFLFIFDKRGHNKIFKEDMKWNLTYLNALYFV